MQFSVVSLLALFTAAMAAPIDGAVVGDLQTRQTTGPKVEEAAMRNDEDGGIVKFSNPGGAAGAA
ncbi:hypothetical protein G6O67_004907 [Ophiocordyceps sinensis]|uniref:Uncharacterized protein n=2 Tax=Ophiocordyceps sinensis TaxID=72228 RepID=A0A8H4PQJ6_9HYPO|nr:hypothetical protein OCS_04002 [Ophiocordyceps sinensis CO18]KAF4508546.1 hypothetical protein G6O67_004907 [Ophiocordyceps sinensis]